MKVIKILNEKTIKGNYYALKELEGDFYVINIQNKKGVDVMICYLNKALGENNIFKMYDGLCAGFGGGAN